MVKTRGNARAATASCTFCKLVLQLCVSDGLGSLAHLSQQLLQAPHTANDASCRGNGARQPGRREPANGQQSRGREDAVLSPISNPDKGTCECGLWQRFYVTLVISRPGLRPPKACSDSSTTPGTSAPKAREGSTTPGTSAPKAREGSTTPGTSALKA